ncbi:MAG: cysteine desulfurase [Acidobacteria bacterium]|nr:cysteine desulfurase [Acidobacteriota bacterium]
MSTRYYFDHNATTLVGDAVLEAYTAALRDVPGNASSIHHHGQLAKQKLEQGRRQVAALLHVSPKEIVFSSGGTESNNLALFGVAKAGCHVITTGIEHPAVLNPCARLEQCGVEVTRVAPQPDGIVAPDAIRAALRANTTLVSVMHANNETGVVQPVEEIARIAHEAGALLHVDGVQAVGKLAVDIPALGADLYSLSGHKLAAPKGVGALYVRQGLQLTPLLYGGHHERDRRAGTENVPAVVALGAAAQWWNENGAEERARLAALRDRLENAILSVNQDIHLNGNRHARVPNTSNIRFYGISGESMVIALDLKGFAVSSGSACSSGAVEPSHVLVAMGLNNEQARSSIRFSLGRTNTADEVDALVRATVESYWHLRRLSPAFDHER